MWMTRKAVVLGWFWRIQNVFQYTLQISKINIFLSDWMTPLSLFTFMHWRRKWQPTSVFLPGESQERRSLVGCSPWGCWGSDKTERLHFDFSLSCLGEGNGNPLQCSCLENPRNGGAWWAAVYGVAQSRTQLKRISSSSSSSPSRTRKYLSASSSPNTNAELPPSPSALFLGPFL